MHVTEMKPSRVEFMSKITLTALAASFHIFKTRRSNVFLTWKEIKVFVSFGETVQKDILTFIIIKWWLALFDLEFGH